MDEGKLTARAGQIEFLDDLYDLPVGQRFALISCKNPYRWKVFGFGIQLVGRRGQPKLFWCSFRDLGRRFDLLGSKLGKARSNQGRFTLSPEARALLVPCPAEQMAAHPVGTAVGDVRNDGPDLFLPLSGGESSTHLFEP
jgi:hypothetical protein